MITTTATLFAMGLLGGGHCIAMCGGVSAVLCSAAPRKGVFGVAYNVGRVLGYATLGALTGAAGGLASNVVLLEMVRVALRAFAALSMLAIGLHLAGLPSVINALERLGAPLWRRIAPRVKRHLPLKTPLHAVGVGLAWSLMPCGMLYGALALAASSGSSDESALGMLAFGAGTLPLMLTLGAVSHRVAGAINRAWVRRLAGVVVLAFGIFSMAGVARAGVGGITAPAAKHACCAHGAR